MLVSLSVHTSNSCLLSLHQECCVIKFFTDDTDTNKKHYEIYNKQVQIEISQYLA